LSDYLSPSVIHFLLSLHDIDIRVVNAQKKTALDMLHEKIDQLEERMSYRNHKTASENPFTGNKEEYLSILNEFNKKK